MGINPFRSSKWRHRSTTVEMRQEDNQTKSPPNNNDTQAAAAQQPSNAPDQQKTNKKQAKQVPFNSDSLLNGIGDYIFESPLGDGKFSKVMLARHYLTGNQVAIKMINKRAHVYRVMVRLAREIALMEVLDHQNIVTLYETYETADALYLIMEYVPGYNLEEYLKSIDKSIIPETMARDIFRQVVKAVDHCHSKWVVHRDLKTPNILLTRDHQVKIADFGLGNRYGLQRLKTICGSMLYYSPEIISARSYVGPEVDSWCLGIMLYRMTAGLELFSHAKTHSELKKYILSRHYKFPPHLSPELQHTIQKCLSLDRYDRLSLKIFLSSDPWFNNHGTLEDIFEQRVPNISYNAHDATESYAESAKSEDNNRIQFSVQNSKRQCKQDLQEEMRRGRKVPKTVIYHSFNPATYFTGPAPHSSSNPINLEAQTRVMAELYENLLVTLKQVRLQQIHNVSLTDLKSPISHLFRKLKHTNSNGLLVDEQQQPKLRKAASAFSLSQLYQRVTKDHISYFSIQCDIRSGSSTTVISGYSTSSTFVSENRPVPVHSKRLSHRLSMVFFSNTLPDLNNPPPSTELKQVECNQSEMIKIVRLACQILGITFYQTSNTQLVCLLTLRNCKKSSVITQSPTPTTTQPSLYRSKLFTSSDRLSERRNQQQQSNSMISNSSSSSINNGWWSRKVHRLSAPFNNASANSQSIVNPGSSAAGLVLGTSSHDLLSVARLTQQEQHQENTVTEEEDAASIDHDPDGFAMLSIDVSSVSCSKQNQDGTPLQIVALRYSKIKGSNKVFKLAKGWIQMALSSRDNQSDPSEQPPQFGGFDRHKADRYETETYMKSVHAKRTFDNNNDDTMIRL